jgi:hypothetical protein
MRYAKEERTPKTARFLECMGCFCRCRACRKAGRPAMEQDLLCCAKTHQNAPRKTSANATQHKRSSLTVTVLKPSRAQARFYSRRQNVLNAQFPYITAALKSLPDETVIDGELVALASDSRPNFNLLQNCRSEQFTSTTRSM